MKNFLFRAKGDRHPLYRAVRADGASRVEVAHLAHDRSNPSLAAWNPTNLASVVSSAKKCVKMSMIIGNSSVGSLSISERNAVSSAYDISIL